MPGSASLQTRTRCKFLHVIARSGATWQSVLSAVGHDRKQYLRRTRKSVYEFARSSASLPSFTAGLRIATPVCALVRNDMLKTGRCQRLQGRFPAVHRQCPLATADAHLPSACHCEERSDVAIRIPAEEAKSKRHLGRIRRRLRACLVVRPCKRGHAASFCMSLRGAKRRGNPYSLQYHKTKRNTLGKYEKHNEFALSTTDLPGFSAGRTDCHTSVRTGSQ